MARRMISDEARRGAEEAALAAALAPPPVRRRVPGDWPKGDVGRVPGDWPKDDPVVTESEGRAILEACRIVGSDR